MAETLSPAEQESTMLNRVKLWGVFQAGHEISAVGVSRYLSVSLPYARFLVDAMHAAGELVISRYRSKSSLSAMYRNPAAVRLVARKETCDQALKALNSAKSPFDSMDGVGGNYMSDEAWESEKMGQIEAVQIVKKTGMPYDPIVEKHRPVREK